MIETTRTFQVKKGKTWETTCTMTGAEALHFLASELAAKYVGKAQYIRSIQRKNNFDGSYEYTVRYTDDFGGGRAIYLTDIY